MLPRYPVYIPSKGRADRSRALTVQALQRDQVPFYVVVEPQEADEYRALAGPESVLVLPFSNLGRGSIPARNWIREHAISNGHARHWQLDDNIMEFRRLWKGRRIVCHAGVCLRVCEDLTDRHENVGVSGLNYQMFVTDDTVAPYYRNCHVYSCVAPETPILCADLQWRDAGTLEVGQEIIAFDEDASDNGEGRAARKYRTAVIERNDPVRKPCRKISTDIGLPIIASEEHPWLVWRSPERERRSKHGPAGEPGSRPARLCWLTTAELRKGDQIAHLANPWKRDESHDGGWISGMFDGEGSLVVRAADRDPERTRGVAIGIAQMQGPVLDRLRQALTDRGYSAWNGNREKRCDGTYLRGGFPEMLRFAGEFQPTRIMNRVREIWEGRNLWRGSTYNLATVTSIEDVGDYAVASITTSTGTFITGGYLSHNCTLVSHAMPYIWRGKMNEDTDLCLQALVNGWTTILVNAFMANKMATMKLTGGNSNELYGMGESGTDTRGRYEMARSLEERWPGLVKTGRRFGRYQHTVNWGAFKTPLSPAAAPSVEIDEYGLKLRAKTEPESPYVREIWETYERDLERMTAFDEVWRGLPAFEARTPPPQLRVECATPEERDSLVKLIGVRVSKKNREAHSAWWPPRPKQDLASLQFVYAGAEELREAS